MRDRVFAVDGHGAGAGQPRIEVSPADEQPRAIPDDRPALSGLERSTDGRFASAEAARAAGRRGGQAKASKTLLARALGIPAAVHSEAFKPYRKAANAFRRNHTTELASLCGGELDAAPMSMIASAALQLAASRFLFDTAASTGDAATFKLASSLANDSRQNLLAAYELGVRAAEARKAANPIAKDPLAAFRVAP